MTGVTKSLAWREHQLKQLAYLLQDAEPLLEEALAIDLGRPKQESHIVELDPTKSEVVYALNHLKKWTEPIKVDTELAWSMSQPRIFREPKGIVLIFGAWNYPIALLIGPLVGAIAAGNSVIIKPSENSPMTCNLLSTLLRQYMDPKNIIVINGAQEQCSALLDLRFDHIFFTGSLPTGKIIARKAAENLTPVTLELGGKCPVIVLDNANFQVVARRIVWAKTVNAGQTCIAPDFILVSEKSESKLIDAIKVALKEFYSGPSSQPTHASQSSLESPLDSQYSKIINRSHFDRLMGYLNHTKGQVVDLDLHSPVQPPTADPDSLRIPLTLIRNVKEDDALMQEELFGPLLPIMTFNPDQGDLLRHLHRINRSPPLAIYAFSQNKEELEFIRLHSKSGQFICNDLLIQFIVPGLPFGGVGTSGIGNYHGYHSFLTFTHERPTLNLPTWTEILLNSRYPPYTPFKSTLVKLLTGASPLKGKSNPDPPVLKSSSTRTSKL